MASIGEQELYELDKIKSKWKSKYPYAIKSCESNWDCISTFFKFSNEFRKIIYSTNVIESLHRQFRKVTAVKSVFPSDDSLVEMLYLASDKVTKKEQFDIETGICSLASYTSPSIVELLKTCNIQLSNLSQKRDNT